MKILFDTNVVLDVLLERKEFLPEAAALLEYAQEKRIAGFLCATTLTTSYYIIEKRKRSKHALRDLDILLTIFSIAPVDEAILRRARHAGFSDYEDAVLHEAARQRGVDGIVTRNTKDFAKAELDIYEPAALLAIIEEVP